VASSPHKGKPSPAEVMTHLLVKSARRHLWIANSYFIPDAPLQNLMVAKRRAGVDARVLAPGPVHDVPPVRAAQRDTYETLLEAGVRIWEYAPTMMHAKTMVVDDRYVVIGSTNFDQLSFDYLEEGSLVADAPHLARKVRQHVEADLTRSKEITRALWADRDLLPEVARQAAGLFGDWL
jgi:cardiolipin synthase